MGTPVPIQAANLGMADSLILMVMALVVFGPRRLPQIGRQIGKLMYEFRKASNDFKFQMEEELRLSEEADRRKKEEAQRQQAAQASVSATPAVAKAIEASSASESPYPPVVEADAARPDDELPRIMPPSTGETVAAARRNPEIPEEAAEPGPPAEVNAASTTHEEDAPATEAVSRNG